MKTTVSSYDFRREFEQCRPNNFSYEALGLLFDYLEEYEESTGEEVELDVIALCCEYSEESAADIFNTYPISCDSEEPTDEEVKESVREYLEDNTQLVGETATGFVYACF